ncbi:glycosyltransferase family 8 protein [Pseudovibrio japonicus]|uniref:glycosyltransferase family 8 protein n=1 Tax=Pseudovibrio japonicus TaxID=366534 RepID=UPI00167518A6|nr:glycosyltransferase family 8 protein [Pseudovibrio japonicus]
MQIQSKDVCVCYCLDQNFWEPTAISFHSLLSHLPKHSEISFLFVQEGLSKEQISFLREMAHKAGVEVAFKAPKSFSENAHTTELLSRAMYHRLFLHQLTDRKRILYLDGDTIISTDITGFATQNLEGKPIAAVCSPGAFPGRMVKHPITGREELFTDYLVRMGAETGVENSYINSGVLLIDADYWRAHEVHIDFAKMIATGEFVYAPDQDLLNAYFYGRIKLLSPNWNFQTSLFHSFKIKDVQIWMKANAAYYNDILGCQHSPAIIHYVYFKPWQHRVMKTGFDKTYLINCFKCFGLSSFFARALRVYMRKTFRKGNTISMDLSLE